MLWAVVLAVGVPLFLLSSGEIGLDEEGCTVAFVICGMFLFIGIGSSISARKGKEHMRTHGGCIACGFPARKNDLFCAKCGCAVVYDKTEGDAK